jgi:hypothetical protein
MESLREKLMEMRMGINGRLDPADEEARQKYPLLYDLLTGQLHEDSKVFEPPRLTLAAQAGEWILQIVDSALAQTLTIAVPSLKTAFQTLEKALADASVHWSIWKGKKPKVGVKRMKPT